MNPIAHGIFTWDGAERRSARYGYFTLADSGYSSGHSEFALDVEQALALESLRVSIKVKVTETRPSGHIGDLFYGIQPSMPEVGEIIELGVGLLDVTSIPPFQGATRGLGLVPDDGRSVLWIDPRILYRLHDQTVEVFIEETDAPFSNAPGLTSGKDGIINNGDGSYQVRNVPVGTKMYPKAKRMVGISGAFTIGFSNYEEGERIDTELDPFLGEKV